MSFAMPPPEVQSAFLWCLEIPLVLYLTQWLPLEAAQRFGVTAITILGTYLAVHLGWKGELWRGMPILTGVALIVATLIVTLGIWGLLTRGYSVALLVGLARIGGRASIDDLARAYSGGRGLRWLADKRLRGLQSFGIVAVSDRSVTVTPAMGMTALGIYGVFRRCFRLREYG